MQNENEVAAEDCFLHCIEKLDINAWKHVKKFVVQFMKDRAKDEFYTAMMQWQESDIEIAVYTTYAYADMALPKLFEVVFEVDNPARYVEIDFVVKFTVLNGYYPSGEISHGHKHICILRFNTTIPAMLKSLPVLQVGKTFKTTTALGFCTKADFEAIRNRTIQNKG